MASSSKNPDATKPELAEIPLIEWIIGALGVVIVAGLLGVLIVEAIAGDKSPPDIQLAVEEIVPLRSGFLVKVRGQNHGGKSAAQVAITAELVADGKVAEESGADFDYLPAHSVRSAGVFFQRDPRGIEIRLRARGYAEP